MLRLARKVASLPNASKAKNFIPKSVKRVASGGESLPHLKNNIRKRKKFLLACVIEDFLRFPVPLRIFFHKWRHVNFFDVGCILFFKAILG